ncbi:tyrosine-type recombinase/integrase [Streptomyces wedmorensis]|uniref:tyrosine-type recombinase/integrase n=1 Tax=Streptomyces wedmorensis TaxID=43759 RepID=UPI00343C1829
MATTVTRESIELLRQRLSVEGKSESTKRGYAGDTRTFFDWLGSDTLPIEDFEFKAAEHLNFCKKYADRKMSTTARRVSGLRGFAWYVHGIDNFLPRYATPKVAPGAPHPLIEGIDGVLQMIDTARTTEERALVALAGLCGARVSEARELRVCDIDLVDMIVTLGGKRDKYRPVPISRQAMPHIVGWMIEVKNMGRENMFDMCDRTARNWLTRIHKEAGLEGEGSSHDLRMTFGTAVYEKTKDIRVVQELLGHASPTTTQIYIGIRLSAMRNGVELDLTA